MLFCVIKDFTHVQKAVEKADGLELRLDCFPRIDLEELKSFLISCRIPVMFTLRKSSQGGFFLGEEAERLSLIEKLISLKPAYFDLEHDIDRDFLQKMAFTYPEVKFIGSYHNLTNTPENLEELLSQVESKHFYGYKFATFAQSSIDALRMLAFVQKMTLSGKKMIGFCMGERGQFTRILGKIYGNFLTYTFVEEPISSIVGQLSLEDLSSIYNYARMDSSTAVYALIGDPIAASIGHVVHNHVMKELSLHAVYVKINVLPSELHEFFQLATTLRLQGLSVTMPLKEAVLPFVEIVDFHGQRAKGVNTLHSAEGKWLGWNKDGAGAIAALENHFSLENKKMVILGAGTTAKAIALSAKEKGADLCILNRTVDRAKKFASEINAEAGSLESINEVSAKGYDILVNCTPEQLPIDPQYILETACVMDINTIPKTSSLLFFAKKKGCLVIYGYEMFAHQASLQEEIWFTQKVSKELVFEIVENKISSCIDEFSRGFCRSCSLA